MCRSIFADDMARFGFSKWQGTGNDFILVDDRAGAFPSTDGDVIRHLCDRHYGVGSDGLILVQGPRVAGCAYHMEFFNPDGSRSFCGNGSRCAFAFFSAISGGAAAGSVRFTAVDGEHTASGTREQVTIGMRDVKGIEVIEPAIDLVHTGSPHLLVWVDDPGAIDLIAAAHVHRYGPRFKEDGVNVNFLRWKGDRLEMRTYERGVENETLSCGTGVTAAALSAMSRGLAQGMCAVHTRGGDLLVEAERTKEGGFRSISLAGPVREVFQGVFDI